MARASFPGVHRALLRAQETSRTSRRHTHPGSLSFLHFIPSIADHTTVGTGAGSCCSSCTFPVAEWRRRSTCRRRSTKTQRIIFMLIGPLVFVFRDRPISPAGPSFSTGVTTNLWTVGSGGLITRRLVPKTPGRDRREEDRRGRRPKDERARAATARRPGEPDASEARTGAGLAAGPRKVRRERRKPGRPVTDDLTVENDRRGPSGRRSGAALRELRASSSRVLRQVGRPAFEVCRRG